MQAFFRSRWYVAGLLVALGCRSEQAAFSFRPTPPAVSSAPAAPAQPLPVAGPLPTPALTGSATPPVAKAAASLHPAPAVLPAPPSQPVVRPFGQRHRQEATAARPRTVARHDTLHIVLGVALVAAGVVAGLLLGGWLGLGVGALVVLLGYYFVVLGIGGQHAWLEIFQEFFNM